MEQNILIDILPDVIDGIKMNVDFRTCILYELLMNDPEITEQEKVIQAIELFFGNQDLSKYDLKDVASRIMFVYSGSRKLHETSVEEAEDTTKIKRIYDFQEDANYIYSAFLEQYNIDLNSIDFMHWWKFKALFNSLSEKTQFSKILGYRSINLSEIKDKKQKAYYSKMKKQYALKDNRTEEEKEQDFASAFI